MGQKQQSKRWVVRFLGAGMALALLLALVVVGWLYRPLSLQAATLSVSIEPGMTVRQIAQQLVIQGVQTQPEWLTLWFRLSGQSRQLKAGNYELQTGVTPIEVLRKLAQGDETLKRLTLVEGWTFRQVRQALAKAEDLKPLSTSWSDEALMAQLGRAGVPAEGRFFPDTYAYSKGSTDVALLARALKAMDRKMAKAWALRRPDSPVANPAQMLTLASIIEKETGHASDRGMVSSVFHNRLKLGMPLQTDPTVIYGLFDRYQGRLRKVDLQTDHPWNTYTRRGLPPTPIAMPGWEALQAAMQPSNSSALYFVARPDGTSAFSNNLRDHNLAVDEHIRRKPRNRSQ